LRIDIGENDLGAIHVRRAGGGEKGYGGYDDLGARPQAQRARRHVQRGRAIGADHGMLGANGRGKPGLKTLNEGPCGQKIAAQRFHDGDNVVLLDELAPIGKKRARLCARQVQAKRARAHA